MLYIAADTFVGRMVDARGGEQASSGKVPWLSAEIQAIGITLGSRRHLAAAALLKTGACLSG
jgi:hypothetical protein